MGLTFVGREHKLKLALDHLSLGEKTDRGSALLISGDSGTGKTYFLKHLIYQEYLRLNSEFTSMYIDLANDEYQSSQVFASLLRLCLIPCNPTPDFPISVPPKRSYQDFRGTFLRKRTASHGLIRSIANAAGALLGLGKAVGEALDQVTGAGKADSVEDEFALYIAWIARRQPLVVAIDNIQFLNIDTRLTMESVLQRVNSNLRLICVDRTVEGTSEMSIPLRCFADQTLTIQIERFDASSTAIVVHNALADFPEGLLNPAAVAEDIYLKTQGLPKDIEYCLRHLYLELAEGAQNPAIEGLIATIDRLPMIHRNFLMISALLDGGIKRIYAQNAVRRLMVITDQNSLDLILDQLLAQEYLKINTRSGDRIRPGHERIIQAMRELATYDEDLQEDVRRALILEFSHALEAGDPSENESYLLHCLIGLQTANELINNLHVISRLIRAQHRSENFSYLSALVDDIRDVIALLPESTIELLLDALQKSSSFDQGLQLVEDMMREGALKQGVGNLFRLKYLVQTYQYNEALTLLRGLGDSEWAPIYRVNILLALCRNDEARSATDKFLRRKRTGEASSVLMRNTVTLYSPDQALRHLQVAYSEFRHTGSDFRIASVETNESLVHIRRGALGDAKKAVNSAIRRMKHTGSRELYQPLVNRAIIAALEGRFEAADDDFAKALLLVPRALLLDQVKIKMNRLLVERLRRRVELEELGKRITDLLMEIRGISMPYLRLALEVNLGQVDERIAVAEDRVRSGLEIEIDDNSGSQRWMMLMSIHWRY